MQIQTDRQKRCGLRFVPALLLLPAGDLWVISILRGVNMADITEIHWTKSKPVSIRDYGNACGFNLITIDIMQLPEEQKQWIEKKIVSSILADLDQTWEEDEWPSPLYDIEKGVYVITIAGNICINYKGGESQVVYIGRGKTRSRIYSHLRNWVSYFSESLQDISFCFWMTEIKVQGSLNAFMDVESELIRRFNTRFGEYPILNFKAGKKFEVEHSFDRTLTKPLRNLPRIKTGWKIKPMPENEWFKEIDEI